MEQFGTMQNGVIVPDNPDTVADGTRVVYESAEEDWPDVPYPFYETREEILASLRESIAEMKAGVKGMPIEEFRAELRREYGTPPESMD